MSGPDRPPILSDAERAAMAARTERATRAGVTAIREARSRDGGTGAFRRCVAKATRALEVPPDEGALPGLVGP